jgi:glycosyltransferase involved in cell wall biosynthesis
MRVLQIGSDRSKRGILFPGTPAFERQQAYANGFDHLDIIGFSLRGDGAVPLAQRNLSIRPTDSFLKLFYGLDTLRIVRTLPKPDVISVQDPFEAGLLGLFIARRLRAPLHVQVHTDFLSPHYAQLSMVNRLRVALAGFVLHRASRVRVVSDRVKSEIIARYGLKTHISVLPIFVDVEHFRSARFNLDVAARFKDFKTKVLVVSRLEPEKNVALAIESFAKVAPAGTCLVIIGEGSERQKLESLAAEKNVADTVFFEGSVAPIDYYPIVDLVLVTSHYEGYGLVIIEALAAGKPVLSTDVGVARAAGAIIADEKHFPEALAEWFKSGPREMQLNKYPYKNFEEYVREYCEDVISCIN